MRRYCQIGLVGKCDPTTQKSLNFSLQNKAWLVVSDLSKAAYDYLYHQQNLPTVIWDVPLSPRRCPIHVIRYEEDEAFIWQALNSEIDCLDISAIKNLRITQEGYLTLLRQSSMPDCLGPQKFALLKLNLAESRRYSASDSLMVARNVGSTYSRLQASDVSAAVASSASAVSGASAAYSSLRRTGSGTSQSRLPAAFIATITCV